MQSPKSLVGGGVSGLVWLTSGSFAQSVIRIGVLAVLARLLTPADFGVVAAATAITGFTDLFSQIGVGPALVQIQDVNETDVDTAYLTTIFLSLLISILLWLSTPFVVGFYRIDLLESVFPVLILLVPLNAFGSTSANLVQKDLHYSVLAVVDLLAYIFGMGVIGVGLAFAGLGVWALVFAQLARALIRAIGLFLSHSFRFGGRFEFKALVRLARLGGGFTLSTLFNYLARRGDYIVIGRLLSADALGLYSKAYNLMDMGNTVLGRGLNTVLFPSVARIQDDPQRLSRVFEHGIAALALLAIPLAVFVAFFADEIVRLVLGERWAEAGPLLQVMALGMFLRLGYKVGGSLARGTGAVYRQSLVQGIYALFIVGGAFIGARYWGLIGTSWSVLIGLSVNYILLSWLGMQVSGAGLPSFLRAHWAGALAGSVLFALLFVLRMFTASLGQGTWLAFALGGILAVVTIAGFLFMDLGDSRTNSWLRAQISRTMRGSSSEK